jgi:hypothetical protein
MTKPSVDLHSVADIYSDAHTKVVELKVPGHPELGTALLKMVAVGGVFYVGLEQVDPKIVVAPPARKDT